ncbi:MAG TPA: hemerythrin domain-containing protein [Myxococcales bacterium]|nr:hemerythrin domain-containing protein [Myxococcales bacterium]
MEASVHREPPADPAATGTAGLFADHALLRQLLDGISEAAEEVVARRLPASPALISLMRELQVILGEHLVQENAVLHPLITASPRSALLAENLRQMHTRESRLLAAVNRWLAREVDAQTLARHAAAFSEAIKLGLAFEERAVFRELRS